MADIAIANQATVRGDLEETWGTERAGFSGYKFGVVSCEITPAQELIENPTIRSDFNEGAPAYGKKSASGTLSMVLDYTSLPWFLNLLCGNIAHSGTSGYTHISKISDDMPKSAIIETVFNIGGDLRYSKATGVRINSFGFNVDPVGFLQANMDVMAKDVAIGLSGYSGGTDWSAVDPFDHLQLATADVKIGGSAVGYIMKGTVKVDANLSGDDYRVGSGGARGSLVPGRYKVSGTLTLGLDSTEVLDLVTAGTPTQLEFTWTNGDFSFKCEMNEVYLSKTGPGIKGEGPITFDVNYKAVYDSGDASSIKFTVINDSTGALYE